MTFDRLRARLHTMRHRKRKESELEEEIRFHLSEEEEALHAEGLSQEDASRVARRDFGSLARIREETRESWGLSWLENVTRNLVRTALRNILHTPRLSLAVILCIGLGMAGTSATVTLVSATLLRPLPYPDAENLVRIWLEEPGKDPRIPLSYPELADLEEALSSLDELEATARARIQFRSEQGSRRVEGEAVSSGYFDLLGIRPALGRLFSEDEHRGLGDRVILLSGTTWAAHYGSDPDIVGRLLSTNEGAYEIVGVLPASFSGTVEADSGDIEFWVPLERYYDRPARERRELRTIWTIAHLAPHASLETARAEAATVSSELSRLFPTSYADRSFDLEPFGENWRSSIRRGSLFLLAAATLVLAVAAANVTLLLLARSIDNRRHWAVRMALGAGRFDVVSLVVLETALLVAAGSAAGMLVGPPALRAFLTPTPLGDANVLGVPVFVRYALDPLATVFCGLFFLFVSLVAALGPALHCLELDVSRVIQDTSRSASARGGRRWFRAIALSEVALTTTLAIGASLLLRSYSGLVNEELGFRTHGVLRIGLFVSETDVPDEGGLEAFRKRVREAILSEPGVRSMGVIWPTVPIDWPVQARFSAPGLPTPHPERGHDVDAFVIDAHLFDTLGMRLVAGRGFEPSDEPDAEPVAIVNRALATLLAGNEADLDRALGVEATIDDRPLRIVGVVDDVRLGGPWEPEGSRHRVFLPFSQSPRRMMSLLIESESEGEGERDPDPAALVAPFRRRLAAVAPTSALDWVGPLDGLVSEQFLRDTRFMLSVISTFALGGLCLCAVGLFALLTDSVARRKGEIGLRQALGAKPRQVFTAILGEAAGIVLVGVGLGTLVAWGAKQSIATMLYGVSATDLGSHLEAFLTIAAVAVAAATVPAIRAARIDPARALRDG